MHFLLQYLHTNGPTGQKKCLIWKCSGFFLPWNELAAGNIFTSVLIDLSGHLSRSVVKLHNFFGRNYTQTDLQVKRVSDLDVWWLVSSALKSVSDWYYFCVLIDFSGLFLRLLVKSHHFYRSASTQMDLRVRMKVWSGHVTACFFVT